MRTHGLVVVGVHTPEFPFERDIDNVRRAAKDMRVEYPIALDSDYAVWQAFANHYWPAVYIADAEGRIRHHQFGEGGYAECEMVIQRLLREAGGEGIPSDMATVDAGGLRGAGRLDEPGVARELPRLRAGPELRLTGARRARRASDVHSAGRAPAQPVGARRRVDIRTSCLCPQPP